MLLDVPSDEGIAIASRSVQSEPATGVWHIQAGSGGGGYVVGFVSSNSKNIKIL